MNLTSRSGQYLTAAEKSELVAAYHGSGSSQRDFAKQHGVASSNFHRWVHQYGQGPLSETPAALVEVTHLLASRSGSGSYRLHFPQGVQLELVRGFDLEEVRALAQLLRRL